MKGRVKKYEYKKTASGRKLILWMQLERGGSAVLGSVEIAGDPTPAELMAAAEIQAVLPDRLKAIRI